MYALPFTFFFSGFAAIVYQVCWQRYLGAALGVDMDSTTTVVSVFMIGIGIGGALGGWVGDLMPRHRALIYAIAEILIGFYALCSLRIFDWAISPRGAMGFSSHWINAIGGFAILLIPTVMMGATLPLLTLIFDEKFSNIGYSVGTLYFINTFGASLGALLTTFYIFDHFNLSQAIWFAASLNFMISAVALIMHIKGRPQ
ncbi:hypothetical protein [Paracidovorax oryzae]|uniref:hypothetical protein n=1 Tax=Paracidovorax oryzae TaxID=862720 RepID=UPI0012FF0332|nr:hypothetical protein [Paracidovorax oryzae]